MSDVELVDSLDHVYKWVIYQLPLQTPFIKKISFSPSLRNVFELQLIAVDGPNGRCLRASINLNGGSVGPIEVTVDAKIGSDVDNIVYTGGKTYGHLFMGTQVFSVRNPIKITYTFKNLVEPSAVTTEPTFADDLKAFLGMSDKVTLVAVDGTVSVSKFLLELRSPALKAMFSHDTKESREKTIELKDFDTKTLTALDHFLTTDKLMDGKETAIGCYLFADQYHIPGLKSLTKKYILGHMSEFDFEEVFDIFMKTDVDVIKTAFRQVYNR